MWPTTIGNERPKSLRDLPSELLQTMVDYLDPIALIALSQACRGLRGFIKPSREDLQNRLLALEVIHDPSRGGLIPVHRPQDGAPLEGFYSGNETNWGDARYACCTCMRLRHYKYFDLRSMQAIRMRKPPLDSRAANEVRLPASLLKRSHYKRAMSQRLDDNKNALWGPYRPLKNFLICRMGVDPQDDSIREPFQAHGRVLDRDIMFEGRSQYLYKELVGMNRYRRRRKCLECSFNEWATQAWQEELHPWTPDQYTLFFATKLPGHRMSHEHARFASPFHPSHIFYGKDIIEFTCFMCEGSKTGVSVDSALSRTCFYYMSRWWRSYIEHYRVCEGCRDVVLKYQ